MASTRRSALLLLAGGSASLAQFQVPPDEPDRFPKPDSDKDDDRLPNGKSQKDAIAQSEHKQALKDVDQLANLVGQLKDELQKSGDYVVPLTAVKKTEEIEKLARRVRGHLRS